MEGENTDRFEKKKQLIEALEAFVGYRFQTAEGVRFEYVVKDEGMHLVAKDTFSCVSAWFDAYQ